MSKLFKLEGKQAIECATRGEFNEWARKFDPESGVVGMTEIEGMTVLTTFRPFVDPKKAVNAVGDLCPFHSRLYLGLPFEFDPELPIPFAGSAHSKGKDVPEYNMATWADAVYVHDLLVKRLRRGFLEAAVTSNAILERFNEPFH